MHSHFSRFCFSLPFFAHSIALPNSFSGALKGNDLLSKTVHLFKGEIRGPESIAPYKGSLFKYFYLFINVGICFVNRTDDVYTALADGRVIRVRNNAYTLVADVSEGQCEGLWDESKCGHPLGIKFDSKGNLYVVDGYYGLKRVNIAEGKGTVTTIFKINTKVNGRASKFLDDVAVHEGGGANGGNVYYLTDVSTKWPLHYTLYCVAEHDKTGRVLKYDEDTKTASVIAEGLSLPNGIELNDAKDALIVAEFSERRLIKIPLKGNKAGKVETFIDKLPGEPDNVRRSSGQKETYWVALAFIRNSSQPTPFDTLSNKPLLRKAIFRFIHALGSCLEYLGTLSNYVPLKEIGYKVKTGYVLQSSSLTSKMRGLAIEVDASGKILRSLHSPDGHTILFSELREVVEGNKKVLYIGSYLNDYLGKLDLN
ncbi:adipocyte plasma membrane-associated protein-like protein [Dinothrombium tinctorium]|uniref:Adipocyte plasma membrane-associated protein-like protein n=1 Tax=Dinothrombium tinctorium TaxID=1965070 RepID=A0A3S3QNQ9_9ACAR|nr:adipocyte plasma membrane-associated protein-like protein [Dinothrombium tinctorium]